MKKQTTLFLSTLIVLSALSIQPAIAYKVKYGNKGRPFVSPGVKITPPVTTPVVTPVVIPPVKITPPVVTPSVVSPSVAPVIVPPVSPSIKIQTQIKK